MNQQEKAIAKVAVNKFRMQQVRAHLTQDSHKKRSESLKGHIVSAETKEKIRQKALGRKHSEETKEKIRLARANQIPWNKGIKDPFKGEENHPRYIGNKISYRSLHHWVEKHLGKPTVCEDCGKTELRSHFIHWANKSGEYKREVTDWIRLCALCHKKFDSLLA